MTTLAFFWRDELWAAALGLALGLTLPLVILVIFRGRRRRQIQGLLPDTFFFMARSLRAGVSLEQSLTRAGEQMEETARRRASPAVPTRSNSASIRRQPCRTPAARNQFARFQRLRFDWSRLANYESGGNLAVLLDRLAATARDRNQFLGYFRAATASASRRRRLPLLGPRGASDRDGQRAIWETLNTRESCLARSPGWQILGIAAVLEVAGIVWFALPASR